MNLKYRPEIDGLRALAVISVIFYHAQLTIQGIETFKGGFIGVDIFFVISGYLITLIIYQELVSTGNFSFLYFYQRRIRRILPALLIVIIASLPVAWIYLLPSSFIDFSKSILYSLGFNSNLYFWNSAERYGAESTLLKPFLHTWSLSVEEKYYIIFPIIFLITFKFFKKYIVYVLLLAFFISLSLAQWGAYNYSSFNFYILPTRGWELITGSLLAILEIKEGKRSNNKFFNEVLPLIGIFLIFHSLFFFHDRLPHPSIFTLSPIIGVSLIIWFCSKESFFTKILSSKIFVGTGLISYSLYLWHYPVFAFLRINHEFQNSFFFITLVCVLIVILSILTYFFVEKPCRNKNIEFKKILLFLSFLLFIIIFFNMFVIQKKGNINKKNQYLQSILESPIFDKECKFSTENNNFLSDKIFINRFKICKKKYEKFILIVGDSHSIDLFNSFSKLSKYNFIISISKGGCRPPGSKTRCHYYNTIKFIEKNKDNIEMIIFNIKGSYMLTNVGSREQQSESLYRKLPLNIKQIENIFDYTNKLNILGKTIIIGPHLEPNISLSRKTIITILEKNNFSKYMHLLNTDLIAVDKKLKEISIKNGTEYISKIELIDFDLSKDFLVNNKITFSDEDHWSSFGEIYFGKKLFSHPLLKEYLK